MNYKGINHLANVLDERTKAISYQPLLLDFGEILDGFKPNSYPIPIPPEDYLVCRHVTWGKKREVLTATQLTGSNGDGRHPHGTVHASDGLGPDPSQVSWDSVPSGKHTHEVTCGVSGEINTDKYTRGRQDRGSAHTRSADPGVHEDVEAGR